MQSQLPRAHRLARVNYPTSVLIPEYCFRYASVSHEKYSESAKFADGVDWLDLVHPEDCGRARAFLDLLSISPHSERAQPPMMPAGAPPRMVEREGTRCAKKAASCR